MVLICDCYLLLIIDMNLYNKSIEDGDRMLFDFMCQNYEYYIHIIHNMLCTLADYINSIGCLNCAC